MDPGFRRDSERGSYQSRDHALRHQLDYSLEGRVPKIANQLQQRQSCRLPIWTGCMAAPRFVKPLLLVGIPVAAIAALLAFWNWDWLIPIVQGRASSMLGREVTIEHLHVQLGRVTTVSAD